MKKLIFISLISSVFSTYALAKDDFMEKLLNFYSISTNGILDFKAKKSADGYEVKISSKQYVYKEIFNPNYTIKVEVDEGPLVTKPHFTFAKAGLVSKIDIFKVFNPEIEKELQKGVQKRPLLHYEAIVGFSDTIQETFKLEPILADDNDSKLSLTPVVAKTTIDLNNYTGKIDIATKELLLEPKNKEGLFRVQGVTLHNEITQKPVNNVVLFGKSMLKVENLEVQSKPDKFALKLAFDIESEIKKVNQKLLDFSLKNTIHTDDVHTIALFKGVKDEKIDLTLKNLGIEGVVELITFSQKMQEIQNKLLQDANDPVKKEAALAEYMAQVALLNNTLVDIINKTFLSNKSKLILDLELQSDKKSFIKLDLLYKAKPLQGDLNSAIIGLMAQGLAIFDGDIEIKLDKELAVTLYPLSTMFLELLKNKGFVSEKNGIYHLKAKLQGGKIVLNGKAYTLQELTTILF